MQKSDIPLTVDKTEGKAKVSSNEKISSTPPQNLVNNGAASGTGNKGKRGNKTGRNQGGRGGKNGQNGRGFQRTNNNSSNSSQNERPKWEENSHNNNGSSKISEVLRYIIHYLNIYCNDKHEFNYFRTANLWKN